MEHAPLFFRFRCAENTDGAPDRAGQTSSLSRDGHSTADPGRRCISMAQDRGTRRALLKPHTLFCGCCCSLKSGVLTGCSLFIIFYGTALITESFSAGRSPDPALAQSFCALEDLEYRATYNACYGLADVCVCDGGSPCVFHKAERQVELAAAFGRLVHIVATLFVVFTFVGAVKQRAELLNHAWRACSLLPPFFTAAAAMDAATWEALRRRRALALTRSRTRTRTLTRTLTRMLTRTLTLTLTLALALTLALTPTLTLRRLRVADEYWFRAAADQVGYGPNPNPGLNRNRNRSRYPNPNPIPSPHPHPHPHPSLPNPNPIPN